MVKVIYKGSTADVLGQLWQKIKKKEGLKLTRAELFHRDNAPAHMATVVMAMIKNWMS